MSITALNRLEMAQRALQAYALQPMVVTFIQHSENLTFQVEAREGMYLLRLHSPVTAAFGAYGADPATVESEMLWLQALIRQGLAVPPPVKTSAGQFVSQVDGINVTLLKWQAGDVLTRDTESEETAAQMGALVGQLHARASRWKPPQKFTRPRRDMASFQAALASLWPAVEDGRISYRDYQTLQTTLSQLKETSYRLRGKKIEGLLHGDLHRGNFLLHEGQISLIDFSMCAYGFFAYDLGTCLSNVRPAFHPLFLEYYTRFFPLPAGYERLLEGYFLASYIVTFSLWIADPASQETLVQRMAYIASEYAARFNRDARFWFSNL